MRLIEVDAHTFSNVKAQFEHSWKHPHKRLPTIEKVYKVWRSEWVIPFHTKYCERLEEKGSFRAQGLEMGNERKRWHGTKRICRIGDPVGGPSHECYDDDCSLCSIIRTSFHVSYYGQGTGWGRFGRGVYTSSASSKADDYSKNAGDASSSEYKVLLLNNVAAGRGYKVYNVTPDMAHWTAPPDGYDSVIGEPGSSLNYDELVVYADNAIVPAYVVVYS